VHGPLPMRHFYYLYDGPVALADEKRIKGVGEFKMASRHTWAWGPPPNYQGCGLTLFASSTMSIRLGTRSAAT